MKPRRARGTIRTLAAVALSASGALLAIGGCAATGPAVASPGGEPSEDAVARRARLETDLAEARAAYEVAPHNEEAIIWLGRRLAYLGRYEEAVAVYTEGLAIHPESFRLLRHRGHRFITLRRFAEAERDLSAAARLSMGRPDAVEPDGAPNARGIPRSTDQTNIWYHLGLAYYLQGKFEEAHHACAQCRALAPNDDMLVAAAYWQYLSARQQGLPGLAARALKGITAGMDVIENHAYHRLLRLFQGELRAARLLRDPGGGGAAVDAGIEDATAGYGVAMHHLFGGRCQAARALLERLAASDAQAAFGVIAAQAELARLGAAP